MQLDKQTRARLQNFVRRHHNTEWYPCVDDFAVNYYGTQIFTISDTFVNLCPTRKNPSTMGRLNELLSIFQIDYVVVMHYREWFVEHKGKREQFGHNFVIRRGRVKVHDDVVRRIG